MERDWILIEQHKFTLDQIKQSQAVPADYKGCPCGHMDNKESKKSTYTLTNVVPQNSSLNDGQWKVYERKTMIEMTKGCTTTYVVTGAVPGENYISNKRVNVPSHIWSAACCLVGTEPRKAWGAIAENDKNKVEELSLGELEKRLTDLYKGEVTLFNNTCPQK
ncbi:endonuclease domain-containing 1 protein-like [Pyrgilauda ruficollis]|uniref:endonuclease domain-containing 1 protein-like n=1 Tax=Pyrgilauda ruficollis TaxID=221976 RepID=UPI001B869A16|nr:endonuclease domain-containing 1 protein-like [Pyrgilauda ruficollis]